MRHIKGLRIDLDHIEGELELPEEFKRLHVLERADILRDWVYCITHEYNSTVEELQGRVSRQPEAVQ